MDNAIKRAIFIVGSSRSGTSMMSRILGNHPGIFAFSHELHFFEELWSSEDRERSLTREEAISLAMKLLSRSREGYLTQGSNGLFRREAEALVDAVGQANLTASGIFSLFLFRSAAENGKTIPCDQTPRNLFYIDEILRMFPGARVINMVRDPRDVLLSQKRKWMVRFKLGEMGRATVPRREAFRSWINYHPLTMSKLWNSSIGAADRHAGDKRVMIVKYEQLLSDPVDVVGRICEFIGVSFSESLLDIPVLGSSSETYRAVQRGINKGRAGSWKKGGVNPTEVYICQKINAPFMKKYGYTPERIAPNAFRLLYYVLSFPAGISLALMVNAGRMKNIRETLKRRLGKRGTGS